MNQSSRQSIKPIPEILDTNQSIKQQQSKSNLLSNKPNESFSKDKNSGGGEK